MQKLNKKNIVYFTGCLLLTVLLLVGCATDSDLEVSLQERETEDSSGQELEITKESDLAETGQGIVAETQEENPSEIQGATYQDSIYVQITGAVRWPGVYEMPPHARVFEAVEKAGGMTEEAEPSAVNQATQLTDGEMVHIYTREEWKEMQKAQQTPISGREAAVSEPDDGRVNINTADKEQLCSISGIGEARAESIITYRDEHGAFGSIEEIKNVSGIKEGLYQKIKDKIKV